MASVRESRLVRRMVYVMAAITVLGLGGMKAVAAQEATPAPGGLVSTVSVSGHGVVNVTPDTASITVGVDVTRPTLGEAQSTAATQMQDVIDALKAANVAERDIQTTNYSVNIIRTYDDRGTPGEIQGFQVSNQVVVKLRDVDKVGKILDDVVGKGANNIYGISFFVDDPTSAASQARAAAVKDATKKADELASAAGMTLGPVVSISEGGVTPPTPVFRGAAGGASDEAGAAPPIQTGSTEISVDVQVVFELS